MDKELQKILISKLDSLSADEIVFFVYKELFNVNTRRIAICRGSSRTTVAKKLKKVYKELYYIHNQSEIIAAIQAAFCDLDK